MGRRLTLALRLAVVAGAAAYVSGGWIGWFTSEFGLPTATVRLHELSGTVGEWAWLGVAPMLAAGFAPFGRRARRFLWLAAVLPLACATALLRSGAYVDSGFPFLVFTDERHWGLTLSVVGGSVALAALIAVALGPGAVPRRRQRAAPVVVLLLAVVAVVAVRGGRDEAAEADLRARLAGCPDVRVECRDRVGRPPMCAFLQAGAGNAFPWDGFTYLPVC